MKPQTCEEWANVAARFWSVANELIHHIDAGRIAIVPGLSFTDRKLAHGYIDAVRTLLTDAPFEGQPEDSGPSNEPRGAA